MSAVRTALRHFKHRSIGRKVWGTRQGRLIDARLESPDIHDALGVPELHFTRAGKRQLGKLSGDDTG